ncbi:MAG TPA: hypothetical protein VG873_11885 [Burkholderiales bacterium]|nr:hypothetical protein [Burkholderiales bacterium]
MNTLAAMALAAGELVCEFDSTGILLYAMQSADRGSVLQSGRHGRRSVFLKDAGGEAHLVEDDGTSVRTTALTTCTRSKGGACTRFAAAHAWHFDPRAHQLPAGATPGVCEPWRMD